MNEHSGFYAIVAVAMVLFSLALRPAAAEKLKFLPIHTAAQRQCLADLVRESRWRDSREVDPETLATAIAAEANLSGGRRRAYFYVFEGPGWCGTIGCPLLIGEVRWGAKCHLLYDGTGFANALREHGGLRPAMDVLRARDHGYRRLYTPCDTRFDGKQYQKLHEECSRLDIPR
jgi:hypothetical protein